MLAVRATPFHGANEANEGTQTTRARLATEVASAGPVAPPALHCPLPSAIHPDAAAIQARSVAWALATGIAPTGSAARIEAAAIGRLSSRAHPHGDVRAVQLGADWTTLFCLLDDRIERIGHGARVRAWLTGLEACLAGGAVATDDPFARACTDIGARLVALGPPAWRGRFLARVAELFAAFVRESEVRAGGGILPLVKYLPLREVTVGLHVEFVLGERAEEIGEEVHRDVRLSALARRASNIVGWANDIYTHGKELRAGEFENLVAVLADAGDLPLRDAVEHAAGLHDDEVRAFVAGCEALGRSGASQGERRYAAMLESWVRGHLDWAMETGRYSP